MEIKKENAPELSSREHKMKKIKQLLNIKFYKGFSVNVTYRN